MTIREIINELEENIIQLKEENVKLKEELAREKDEKMKLTRELHILKRKMARVDVTSYISPIVTVPELVTENPELVTENNDQDMSDEASVEDTSEKPRRSRRRKDIEVVE